MYNRVCCPDNIKSLESRSGYGFGSTSDYGNRCMRFFTVSKFSYNISGQIGTIGEREIMRLIIAILLYFLLRRIWKNFKNRIEKLDEYNGEFIFTFFSKFWKKEG